MLCTGDLHLKAVEDPACSNLQCEMDSHQLGLVRDMCYAIDTKNLSLSCANCRVAETTTEQQVINLEVSVGEV